MEGIDLSGWKVAFNGAEPVRAESIRRFCETFAPHGFAASAMLPAYGMAEATVLVSAGAARRRPGDADRQPRRAARTAVSRRPTIRTTRRRSSDAEARSPASGSRSSIPTAWLGSTPGGSAKSGSPAPMSRAAIGRTPRRAPPRSGRRIAGEAIRGAGGRWLRTGDLGFLDEGGELYITGRVKDVVIIRGANHYPQDIEDTVQEAHPALRRHGGAAFAAQDGNGAERLVVVQEVERTWRNRIDIDEIVGRIREAVVTEHEIVPYRDRAAAARRIAENHQRQDPAGLEPQAVAGGIA